MDLTHWIVTSTVLVMETELLELIKTVREEKK